MAMLQLLVERGADINARDWQHKTAADIAAEAGHAAAAAYLCRLPQADPTRHIAAACWAGLADVVRDYIARGADVESTFCERKPCLWLAAERGHMEVARALLDAGAVMDAGTGMQHGPALHAAARSGDMAMLQLLVELGADVDARDGEGRIAAELAAKAGHAAAAAYLRGLPQAAPAGRPAAT